MMRPSRILPVLVAAGLATGGTAAFRLLTTSPQAVALEETDRAARQAETQQDRIRAALHAIEADIEAAGDISTASSRIRRLTLRQRRSLSDLADLLEEQLRYLESAAAALGDARSSTRSLVRLGAAQVERLERALAALRTIEALAADAGFRSARFARDARYAARLARDSYRSFSGQ